MEARSKAWVLATRILESQIWIPQAMPATSCIVLSCVALPHRRERRWSRWSHVGDWQHIKEPYGIFHRPFLAKFLLLCFVTICLLAEDCQTALVNKSEMNRKCSSTVWSRVQGRGSIPRWTEWLIVSCKINYFVYLITCFILLLLLLLTSS
jgi:hypothetical protein